jgi:hypothetical protein
MKINKLKRVLHLSIVLCAVGMISVAQAAAIVVHLDVNESQTKLVPTTPGNCARNNTPGCVRASGQVQINFNLTGNTNCSLDHVALGNPGGISAVAASDFNADQGSGYVTPISQSGRHILIRDNNSQAYDVAYTVYANCDGTVINSDPRVENDGTGQP